LHIDGDVDVVDDAVLSPEDAADLFDDPPGALIRPRARYDLDAILRHFGDV
jgi:hypothetical protein